MECQWDSIEGLHWAVEGFISLFYTDDVLVASIYPEMLQSSINVLTELFEQVRLLTNTKKTQILVCVPGKVRVRLLTSSYHCMKDSFHTAKDWANRRVECSQCRLDLTASSLPSHLKTQHGVYQSNLLE